MGLATWEIKRVPRINPFWIMWVDTADGQMFIATGRGLPAVCYYNKEDAGLSYVPRLPEMPLDFTNPVVLKVVEEMAVGKPHMFGAAEELETIVQLTSQCDNVEQMISHPNYILMTQRTWDVNRFSVDTGTGTGPDVVEHFHTDVCMTARGPADLNAYIYLLPIPWMCVTYHRGSELVYLDHFILEDTDFLQGQDSDMVRVWGEWIQQVYDLSAIAAEYNAKVQVDEV